MFLNRLNSMKNYNLIVKVLLGYLVVTLILTFPLIINISDSIYGIPHDNFGTLWDESLSAGKVIGG